MIQTSSNFQASGISCDLYLVTQDMIGLADLVLAESPPMKFAYKKFAWVTYVSEWEALWEIITRPNRHNLVCCLETFSIAGRVWADSSSSTGMTPNADRGLATTLDKLVAIIDVEKVFYVQVVHAERLQEALIEGHQYHVATGPEERSASRYRGRWP